ncbi:hypothetical protein BV25DRAFT_1825274 [Artomyces pyxidatus]|uniref:Uncharacterized protein n=1 Tax=Artomyces pyxidatus TaxID=48021 RepID=A0ACB8T2N7_9AGAM|nr:hypothetical protein BV25DRAFT_1825274 [Artomyces pyxidatus]
MPCLPTTAQSSQQPEPRRFDSVLNEYLSSTYPAFKRMTDEEVRAMLLREGATEATISGCGCPGRTQCSNYNDLHK